MVAGGSHSSSERVAGPLVGGLWPRESPTSVSRGRPCQGHSGQGHRGHQALPRKGTPGWRPREGRAHLCQFSFLKRASRCISAPGTSFSALGITSFVGRGAGLLGPVLLCAASECPARAPSPVTAEPGGPRGTLRPLGESSISTGLPPWGGPGRWSCRWGGARQAHLSPVVPLFSPYFPPFCQDCRCRVHCGT